MLSLLAKYARDHDLAAEPGFAPRFAKWCIDFDSKHGFVQVRRLGNPKQKPYRGERFDVCPSLEQPDLVGGRSHFLIDYARVVAPLSRDPSKGAGGVKTREAFFTHLLREASGCMPALLPVAMALDDEKVLYQIAVDYRSKGVKPNDWTTISIDFEYPVDSADWHKWWRGFVSSLRDDKRRKSSKVRPARMRCFVTGSLCTPCASHETIKNLNDVGGSSMGDRLICFDKRAFESYGLSKSENCAVSDQSMSEYRAALNELISKAGAVLAGSKVIHWYTRNLSSEDDWLSAIDNPLASAEAVASKRAAELLESIREGKRPDLLGSRYYALTLSGSSHRVMVRGWMEGRFECLVENVRSWFEDLEIVSVDGSTLARDPAIGRVVKSMLLPKKPRQKYLDWVQPVQVHAQALWAAALRKETPIPYSVLARATSLHIRFSQEGRLDDAFKRSSRERDHGGNVSLVQLRMALIKAYHTRRKGGDEQLKHHVNEGHPHPAYQCGRLMAVLADLQRAALGDVGANITQRYYAAASATPRLLFGRLVRLSRFHLGNLQKKMPGLATKLDRRIAEISTKIGDDFPKALTLEEQSLFALGYYQQIAEDMARRGVAGGGDTSQDDDVVEDTGGDING